MINEKTLRRFTILLTVTAFIAVTVFYVTSLVSFQNFLSFLLGAVLSILNFLLGFLFLNYGIKKPDKIFMIIIWGGMTFRIILLLTLVFIILYFLEINTVTFIFSIFIFYIFYLFDEIFYLLIRSKQ
jgi:hypothetical protein